MFAPTLTTFRALSDLADRFDADERCTMLRMGVDEGDDLDNPLVQILVAYDRHAEDGIGLIAELNAADPLTQRLLARLIALGCDGRRIARRRTVDPDPRAYLSANLLSGEAVIAAHYWPLPEPIAGLRAVLTDPDLDDAHRVEAALALDPRAADWISWALAQGAHPDATGRFYASFSQEAAPTRFEVIDRTSNLCLITRRDREDAELVAAVLNAFPEPARTLVEIRQAWDQDEAEFTREAVAPKPRRTILGIHQTRWQTAWAELGRATEAWRNAQGYRINPWSPVRAVA